MTARIDATGHRYGRLTMLRPDQNDGNGRTCWLARCDCGTEKVIRLASVRNGVTTSCGCVHREGLVNRNRVHGHALKGAASPTYRSWQSMLARVTNPKKPRWKDYGGRGIAVCERWQSFENFLADMGEKPPHLSLDRINNDGNYEPGNCRWATAKEQANNKRNNVKANTCEASI